MNTKLTPVALAVAFTLAAPLTAQADGHAGSGFYGSARVGVEYSDPGGATDAQLNVRSWASRFGFAGETEMANGLTGFGKYEFGVNTSGSPSVRHAHVGLKGDFGKVTLGQAYHTWYNNVIAPIDQPWWGSCNGCLSYTGRTTALTYQGNFGAGSGGISLIASNDFPQRDGTGDEDVLDGFEIGATFPLGGVSLGLGMQDLNNGSEATVGVAVKGSAGTIGYALSVSSQGGSTSAGTIDTTGIQLFTSFGNAYLDIGTRMNDAADSLGFTLGYTKGIGENTTSWYELQSSDSGIDGADASLTVRAALKHDWK